MEGEEVLGGRGEQDHHAVPSRDDGRGHALRLRHHRGAPDACPIAEDLQSVLCRRTIGKGGQEHGHFGEQLRAPSLERNLPFGRPVDPYGPHEAGMGGRDLQGDCEGGCLAGAHDHAMTRIGAELVAAEDHLARRDGGIAGIGI